MEKKLKRNQEYYVKIELDGYKSYNANISKGFNGMVFGNLIFGGIIGIIIDASTGSMHTLNPKVIEPNLEIEDKVIETIPDIANQDI